MISVNYHSSILAEFSAPGTAPSPTSQHEGLRRGGGETGGGGLSSAWGARREGTGEGLRPTQEEEKGEGRPLSPSLPLKTSLVSITAD